MLNTLLADLTLTESLLIVILIVLLISFFMKRI